VSVDAHTYTETLAGFASLVGSYDDAAGALQGGVEQAREGLRAHTATVVRDGMVLADAGPPSSADDAVLVIPVHDAELLICRDEPFTAEEHALARGLAHVLALRLETMATLASLRERQALLERLSRIQQSITSRADLQEVLDAIVAGAQELLDEPHAALRLVDKEDPERMEIVSALGFEPEVLEQVRHGRVGDGAGGRAIAEERLIVIEDYETNPTALSTMPKGTVQAAMAAPVRDSGRVVGSLVVASYVPGRRYSRHEQDVLRSFADHASIAVTDAHMVASAVHQSVHDALTGLPNRTLFCDRVEHALAVARRRASRVAVLFLDLDRFKHINDLHGHHAGDELLVGVAERLREALRAGDTVARLGGDEFAVLLEDIESEKDAIHVAENLAGVFTRPFAVGGREHFVTCSLGIALSHEGVDDPGLLLRNADAAMYRAKEKGRAGYELYDEDLRERMTYRRRVEDELGVALDSGQLRLAFQPVVELPSRRIVGAEALLRWEHPEKGLVAAGEFIHVAEESGLVVPLGNWALEAACAEASRWRQRTSGAEPPWIAVNLSPRQLGQPRLAGTIAELLARYGLAPSALVLEVTEHVLLDDAETPRATLAALRALGVQLVLDDFGTGYASLAYLRRLPLQGLKVDRSFVRGLGIDPEDTAIVEAVGGIARGMNLQLIAEGVETERQVSELIALGCPRAQGYLFSRPVPGEDFERLLVES
jgi:diguanylate cyclase (GGDEF)-like protein